MTTNESPVDRTLRVLVGSALVAFALGLIFPGTGWNWLGWFGIVPIITGLIGNCPAYSLLGISTCSVRRTHDT